MGVLARPRHLEPRTIRQPGWVRVASSRGVVEGHRSRSSKVSGTPSHMILDTYLSFGWQIIQPLRCSGVSGQGLDHRCDH